MSYDPETILRTLFEIAETADSPEHAEEAVAHLAKAMEEGEDGDATGDEVTLGPAGEWVAYTGPREGQGWKNTATGDIVYGGEKPGGHEGATASEGEKKPARSASAEKKAPAKASPKAKAVRGEMLGATREGKGKDARIVLADGRPAPAHILPKMVGQDWTDVKVAADPSAEVLVTGRDKKGRAKTVYSVAHDMRKAAAKFARTQEGLVLAEEMARENQGNRNGPDREHAECCWLMMAQGTRPGSEADNKGTAKLFDKPVSAKDVITRPAKKGKGEDVFLVVDGEDVPIKDKKTRAELLRRVEAGEPLHDSTFWLKSHGATTLEGRHVVEEDGQVFVRFVGKESVWHNHRIRDPKLAEVLLARKKKASDRGKLFGTSYDKVTAYAKTLDGGKFTPKDFRTRLACKLALHEVEKYADEGPPKSAKERDLRVKHVGEVVSSVLGNDWKMAVKSYIDPSIFSVWGV